MKDMSSATSKTHKTPWNPGNQTCDSSCPRWVCLGNASVIHLIWRQSGVEKTLVTSQKAFKLNSRRGSAVHHAAGHVLAVARITFDHHGCGFEDRHSNLCHGKLLMVSLFRRDDWSIGGQHEVNARVRHQIGLEPWILHLLTQHAICWLLNTWDMHLRCMTPCRFESTKQNTM